MADKSERAQREEEILKFWKENKIFEKSLEQSKGKKEFVFYDGPPFATGLPHYGHILPGTIKDVIPRYKTMRGYHVPRRWGWDCHGLPIENLVEKELGLETKKDIEKFGIGEFNKRARDSVLRFEKDWKEIIPRTGRWIDMDNAYKTMDPSFTESVWWSFKHLYEKGLVYQGFKSMHLCPRCETTLSNFEVNQGYKDITDISVYVKFQLENEPNTFFLVWTTTPWTLPGNVALAVNPELDYVKVEVEKENYILAKDRLSVLKDRRYKIVEEFKGKDIVYKKRYKIIFPYYLNEEVLPYENILPASFVTASGGTGIVHIAPAFGEEDYKLYSDRSLKKIPGFIQHVGVDGKFKKEVIDFMGMSVKPKSDDDGERLSADIAIIRYLQEHGNYFDKEKITHSYPHCWRCDTPLLNYASSSWFVKVTEIKDRLVKNNRGVKWIPEDLRDGRFGKWLEGARDWAVSRSRFWGAPLPVWQNADKSRNVVVDSVETLRKHVKKSGNKYFVMRHGQALNNAKNILDLTGDPENHLTELGEGEVKQAASNLRKEKIDLIITSPFLRTKETANILQKELGLPENVVVIDERLHEIGPEEDGAKVRRRMGECLFEAEKHYTNKNVLLISHGFPIWTLFKAASGAPTDWHERVNPLKPAEVKAMSFTPYPHNEDFELDLHRPYIDEIVLEIDGAEYKRVPEVFDTWYDSGSVPFASKASRELVPADFIAEGLDQTRGWFYTMAVLGTALFGKSPYKNVVVHGLVLAEDGKKMSKRLKNYPELNDVLDKYGADALRHYLVSSQAIRGEDLAFSEKGLDEIVKKNINRLENMLSFYELYSNQNFRQDSKHVLDQWIDAKLAKLSEEVTKGLDSYELDKASRPIAGFIDDLSTWYLRRSRTRPEAIPKLREVLIELSKLIAPFMPFISEDIYRRLKGEKESVHLCDWPSSGKGWLAGIFNNDKKILESMAETRRIVSLALEARSKANIKVRQPLAELRFKTQDLGEEYLEIIKDEINVKKISNRDIEGVELDTNLTPELIEEGNIRDVIRSLQEWRKVKGLQPGQKAKYEVMESREFYLKHKEVIEKATQVELV